MSSYSLFLSFVEHAVEEESHSSFFEDSLKSVDEIEAFYLLKNFSSFIVIVSPEITKAKKNNVSKHLLLSFMFIWSQTEYCGISDVLQGQVAITVMAWFSFGRHK